MDHIAKTVNLALYCAFAIPASVVDLRSRRIPDALTLLGVIALCVSTALLSTEFFISMLFAGILCSSLFLVFRHFTKGLGLGDVKFVALTGLVCGIAGSVLALLFASASTLVFWGILATRGKANLSTKIPFAPFITFGTIVSALVSSFVI